MKRIIMTMFAAGALAGCQTADPASRSNRTRYGGIRISQSTGVTLTIGDGLIASADGGGDTQSNSPVQTTDTKPEVAVGLGGGTAGTGGAKPAAGLTEAAASAVSKLLGIGNGRGEKLSADEARAIKDCADGNCSD